MAAKPQAMSQGQLDQSQVRAPPSSLQRQPRPQGDLSDSFYFDPKLQPENFKVLNDLNSRETIRTPPQAGKGSYSPGDEVLIRLQSSASFLDRQQTNFKIEFENTSAKTGNDHNYILADGGDVLLDDLEIEVGEQIAEKMEEGARYYQHLLLSTANQGHYDHEANALMKSWKYKSFVNTYNIKTANGDVDVDGSTDWAHKDLDRFQTAKQTMIVHPDNLAFFRGSRFMPLFADVVLRVKLPEAKKIMVENPRVGATGTDPAYKINSIELMTEHVFPQTELLNSVHDRIFRSPSGLSMVMDGAVDVYKRDLADSVQNNINIQASYSNIKDIIALVYQKGSDKTRDDVNEAPLSNLKQWKVTIQTHELGTRGGTFGLEESYANYRKAYNFLSDIGGQGMLDFDRYKNHHTVLAVNTDLLPDAPGEVLQNSLSTNDRGSQINMELEVDSPANLGNHRLVVFVVHKRILQLKEGIAKIGI
jgi:hypothetical protein